MWYFNESLLCHLFVAILFILTEALIAYAEILHVQDEFLPIVFPDQQQQVLLRLACPPLQPLN